MNSKLEMASSDNCAKTAVFTYKRTTLFHYSPLAKLTSSIPLVIVFALINRPYILDITPKNSLIKKLLEAGLNVYLIDWGYPAAVDHSYSLEDYILKDMRYSITHLLKKQQYSQINLLGVCQGGVFSLCYGCIYPKQIKNLIIVTTPVDFHTPDNIVTQLIKGIKLNSLNNTRNIPGHWLTQFFLSLKPFYHLGKKHLDLVTHSACPKTLQRFMAIEKWIYDNPDQAGKAFKQFITQFYQQNNLIKGKFRLSKHNINLKQLTIPLLNIVALNDHIIPASACLALQHYIGSNDYTTLQIKSGHTGIYLNEQNCHTLSKTLIKWLNNH